MDRLYAIFWRGTLWSTRFSEARVTADAMPGAFVRLPPTANPAGSALAAPPVNSQYQQEQSR